MAQRQTKSNTLPTRSDNEVEIRRELGDWKRVLELLESTKGKGTTNAEPLMNFLYGESRLEQWLEEHQPTEKYISKARSTLIDVKKTILLCLSQTGDQSGLRTDAHILLAKINYASALFEETLEELEKSKFEQIDAVAQTVRNLQLMAEANAMKAHCIEKVGRSWKGCNGMSEAERKKESTRLYLKSADLAIAHFQQLEKVAQQTSTPTSSTAPPPPMATSPSPNPLSNHPTLEKKRASSLLDYAIRRGPTLLLEDGRSEEAVKRIHWMLRSQESQLFAPIRLILSRRLVEVLLRLKWNPSSLPTISVDTLRPKYHVGAKIFDPANVWEEVFLVLLLAEGMVVRDGVLNQAPEFAKARKLANLNAASVFNLLALTAARWGQYSLVNESMDKALKFSFEEPHLWKQYGLSFHASGHITRRSIATLVEAYKLNPKCTSLLLMAAKEQFTRLNVKSGLDFVHQAKKKEEDWKQKLASRVLLYEGIGYFLQSFEKFMHQQRCERLDASLGVMHEASELDPHDYLTLHWLARINAWKGSTNEAFAVAIRALRVFPFHLPTLQLVVLLLSAQKSYSDGLAIVEETLDEYPEHLGFLQLKAALEEKILGPEVALGTLKQMLVIWKKLFDDGNFPLRCDSPDSRYPGGGMGTLQLPSPTDKESVSSFRAAPSMTGSSTNTATLTGGFRADAALSEIASSISIHNSVLHSTTQSELAWAAQINIWLMITDIYLKLDQPNQAVSSLDEASQISYTHPDVLYYRGQVAEYCKEYSEARIAYESAIAVRPTHIRALQSLALMQHYFGSHRLAEKTLQDALKLDPYEHHTWYNLGKVLEALGECSEAGDCMATALEIEAIAPILPYSIIPVCFE
ncbi:tetratricopeptide repeat protein 7B isoform X2 [Folsomia candida]|uniref:tetratricopeptide repeat protein 7B isoform X2 n=1 Tax=Folsomia candida TaxID=158441 RepID=UPI000B8FDA41|nr:tetratricopeptide repeat protein 7B isoform X2 [Folsomia candida]